MYDRVHLFDFVFIPLKQTTMSDDTYTPPNESDRLLIERYYNILINCVAYRTQDSGNCYAILVVNGEDIPQLSWRGISERECRAELPGLLRDWIYSCLKTTWRDYIIKLVEDATTFHANRTDR